jgi:glyoxylase-like metal-dependent hydrolase (beta-lactamase superfamily II)
MPDRSPPTHDAGFAEVADRCFVARFEFLDVNVGLVAGSRGLLMVDTLASEVAARRAVEQVRRLGLGDVVAVVNTHEHFDHTFGNVVVSEAYGAPPILAHEEAAAGLLSSGPAMQAEAAGDDSDLRHADIAATRLLAPTETFSSALVVDLGDRQVEVLHPGRGHTAGDAVVRVPDADTLFAGDLVEESSLRQGVPGFGADCYPLEWPLTLDLVVGLLTSRSVVVPGHGLPVDRDFVTEQRSAIGIVAETVRDLATEQAQWPYPREELVQAVRRGYEHLPRSARQLPLI